MTNHCKESGAPFEISDADREFYIRMGIPLPSLCPDERRRRRLMFRNERKLYRIQCGATGSSIVSIHKGDAPFPVYSQDYWWSDGWDALKYGREIDFSRPFFEQFAEVYNIVPQIALNCPRSENCEYTNQCSDNKDCYLIFSSNTCRNCYHGMWFQKCTDCIDCLYISDSELCYEILNGENCYSCAFSENLQNCSDCYFSKDLIGCRNCIGCYNLRNKENWIDNKPVTAEQFKKYLMELQLGRANHLHRVLEHYRELIQEVPSKYFVGHSCEGFSGDYLQNVKNAYDSFNCRGAENIKYCHDAWEARNCYDLTETYGTDFSLEVEGSEYTNDVRFAMKQSRTTAVTYASHCYHSKDLFGCVGLKNKEHCILNKQYSKEEYLQLRDKLIEHMQSTGEWGSYFPTSMTPFPYNRSVAQEYYPLTREEALAKRYGWDDDEQSTTAAPAEPGVEREISEIGEEILKEVIHCGSTGRPFKIIAAELAFYKKQKIAIPRYSPDQRHLMRMHRRAPRQVIDRECVACQVQLKTCLTESRAVNLLCDECYWKVVN